MILLFVNGSDDNFILRAQSYQNVYFPIRNIPQQHVIITFTRCINHFLSKFYFIFLQTSLPNNSISLSFEPWILYQRPYCFLSFLYFFLTFNKVKAMACHGLHASKQAIYGIFPLNSSFCVFKEISA